jgi:uncharacterized membrane protein
METLVALLVLALLVFPVWTIVRIIALSRENNALAERFGELDRELKRLRDLLSHRRPEEPSKPFTPVPVSANTPHRVEAPAPAAATEAPLSRPPEEAPSMAKGPSLPPPITARPPERSAPPIITPSEIGPVTQSEPEPETPSLIDWEQFMGAKLFAWLGGLAAFLAAAFFVKYSFEHNLIPPEVRVAIGFLFAIGLVIGGLKISRERYAVTSQTLIASGIVSLYAVTFACNSIYHFAFFGPAATLLMLVLVTATAFLLAVRLDARVIAILGMLGGFLTPILLSTGHDNPPGLFGYLALLDLGLIAVALHRRWSVLVALGALGTILMEIGWAMKFLTAEKALIAVVVCVGFCALFLAAYLLAARMHQRTATATAADENATEPVAREIAYAPIGMALTAFGFAFTFITMPAVAARPGLLLPFALLVDIFLLVLAWRDPLLRRLHLAAGAIVFLLIGAWTLTSLSPGLLPWALAFSLAYAVLHTAFPLLLERYHPTAAPTWVSQLFPPLSLVLLIIPLFKLDAVSLLFWPCVLLVDAFAIVVALLTASLVSVAAVLLLTMGVTAVWIFRIPTASVFEPEMLFVIGGFAVLFFGASLWLARRLGPRLSGGSAELNRVFGDPRSQLPAFSALLPFVLLVLMVQRLPLPDPSSVFGLALLLVVLTLGLAVIMSLDWLPACALAGVAALEYAWRARHLHLTEPGPPLLWYVGFYAIFTIFPFAFRRRFAALTGPWAVAALVGVIQFPLIYWLAQELMPTHAFLGLLPAAFAVPPLLSLVAILRAAVANEGARLNQLAWFGGVALLFITLVFPIQFERQWLTIAWALEGAALVWLFHRVPHPGLRATGAVLLVVAFIRLALNPAVLEYHARSGIAVFNWYLYTYGLVTVALFTAARLLAPPRDRVLTVNAPALLNTVGTILAFLLLNIEIADAFSAPGASTLTFEFSGNFARDMSYTIAWALFALVLLLISIWKDLRPGRYAALSLLGTAVLKLFFHDLSQLDSLYRVGALLAVAVIAIAASFAYQRFLPGNDKSKPANHE